MAKFELTKSVEARKLNKRTNQSTNDPPVTIPYGAILDSVEHAPEYVRFSYLAELFQVKPEAVRGALHPLGGAEHPPEAISDFPSSPDSPAVTASVIAPPKGVPVALLFERLSSNLQIFRTKVPGGWLVASSGGGVTFVPDVDHTWDGSTLA